MGQTVLHCLTVFHRLAVLHCQAVNYCVTVLQCLNYSPLPDCLSLSDCSPLFDCSLRLTVLYCLIPSPHIHSFHSLTLVLAMALVMAGKYPWHQTGPEVMPLVVAGIVIIIFQTGPANMGECYLSPSLDGIVGVWNWLVMSSLAPGPQWLLVSVELSSSVTHSRPLEPVLLTELCSFPLGKPHWIPLSDTLGCIFPSCLCDCPLPSCLLTHHPVTLVPLPLSSCSFLLFDSRV